jgi:hypothetical protein
MSAKRRAKLPPSENEDLARVVGVVGVWSKSALEKNDVKTGTADFPR